MLADTIIGRHPGGGDGRGAVAARPRQRGSAGRNVGQVERMGSAVLGGTLVLLGLSRRSLVGAAAALAGGGLLYRAATGYCPLFESLGLNTAEGHAAQGGAPAGAAEVVGVITIGKPAEELERLSRDPLTLSRVMSHFAEVSPAGDDRMHWIVRGPLGRTFAWDTRVVEDRPGELLRWESIEGADLPNEGEVRFRRAQAVAGPRSLLRVRFDPPGGAIGRAAANLLKSVPRSFAERSLHYLKSLAETGEIPTTDHQPAFRADTR